MSYTFLEVLVGERDELYTMKRTIPTDEVIEELRKLLGSKEKRIAQLLITLMQANHYTSLLYPNEHVFITRPEESTLLVSDEKGMCLFPPIEFEDGNVKAERECIIQYVKGEKVCNVLLHGRVWITSCHYGQDRLFIHWPEELGIRGAIAVEDKTDDIRIPLKLRYPVKEVIKKAKINPHVLTLLEKTDLSHEFFFSDTDDEAIGILVLALYRYINYGRWR